VESGAQKSAEADPASRVVGGRPANGGAVYDILDGKHRISRFQVMSLAKKRGPEKKNFLHVGKKEWDGLTKLH